MKKGIKVCFLILLSILWHSCISPKDYSKSTSKSNTLTRNTIIKVTNGDCYVLLNNLLSQDTLADESRFNDVYSSPIVIKQNLIFYDNLCKRIKEFEPPFRNVKLSTTKNILINSPSIYLWEACLIKTTKGLLYYFYGSGLCNGSLCPEYFAFFDKNGTLVGDAYSDLYARKKKKKSISKLENDLGIICIQAYKCEDIKNYWKE